jgi:hypothetical protein
MGQGLSHPRSVTHDPSPTIINLLPRTSLTHSPALTLLAPLKRRQLPSGTVPSRTYLPIVTPVIKDSPKHPAFIGRRASCWACSGVPFSPSRNPNPLAIIEVRHHPPIHPPPGQPEGGEGRRASCMCVPAPPKTPQPRSVSPS